ncbi:MAG: TolC family protein [Ignavibacteria bacterium]|nr:TolC family protein [Ignavibacteria bacterium]
MNSSRIKILAAIFLICGSVYSQPVTLRQAINIALDRSDKVKQYTERVEQKKSAYKESKGNFLPNINLTGGFNHMDDNLMIDLDPIRQAMIKIQAGNQVEFANVYNLLQSGVPLTAQQRAALYGTYSSSLSKMIPLFQDQLKKQDYWTTTITGMQPLFMGGKLLSAKNIAEQDKELAESELAKTKNEVTSDVISNYLNVVLIQNVVKVREDILNGMIKHRNDAKRIFEEGVIAKNQYLRSEVAVADAERNLSDEQNRLSLAIIAFRNALGYKNNEPVEVDDTLVFKSISDSLKSFKESAYLNQPVFKMIDIKKEQISDKYKIDRSEFLPKFYLFGKYELIDKYLSALEPKWVIGVQGSINLFNGFKDYQKLEQTKHTSKEIDYIEADTRSKIDLLIEKNYRDMQNSVVRYNKLEASINLADENFRLTSGRFQTGLSTTLDVIDAQLVLEKNSIERKITLYDYYKSINELYLTSGTPMNFLKIWYKESN